MSLIAGYRAHRSSRRREPHIDVTRPGELVGIDAFRVGRLKGTEGDIWQLTAIEIYSSFDWAELVACPTGNPTDKQTSRFARRIARDLRDAGWQLERVLSDNGNEFRGRRFTTTPAKFGARHTSGARVHWVVRSSGRWVVMPAQQR